MGYLCITAASKLKRLGQDTEDPMVKNLGGKKDIFYLLWVSL